MLDQIARIVLTGFSKAFPEKCWILPAHMSHSVYLYILTSKSLVFLLMYLVDPSSDIWTCALIGYADGRLAEQITEIVIESVKTTFI